MRNRTAVAVWLGVIIGMIAIVAIGVADAWVDTSWNVPALEFGKGLPVDAGRMQRQAIFLRTCHVALDHGIQFVLLSVLICVGFSRWLCKPAGGVSRAMRVCVRSWRIYLCLLTLACVLGWNADFAIAPFPLSDRAFVEGEGLSGVGHIVLALSALVFPLVSLIGGFLIEGNGGERRRDCEDSHVPASANSCDCGSIPGGPAFGSKASNEKEYAACWH
jgi:hypothetical protein